MSLNSYTIKTPIGDFEKAILTSPEKDELSRKSEESLYSTSVSSVTSESVFEKSINNSLDVDVVELDHNTEIKENNDIAKSTDDITVTVSTNYNFNDDNDQVSEFFNIVNSEIIQIGIDPFKAGQYNAAAALPFINVENNLEMDTPLRPCTVIEKNRNVLEIIMKQNNFDHFLSQHAPEYTSIDVENNSDISSKTDINSKSDTNINHLENRLLNLQANYEYMINDINNLRNVRVRFDELQQENETLRTDLTNSRNDNILHSDRIKYLETSVCSIQKDTYSSYIEFKLIQNKLKLLELELDKFQQYNRRESIEISGLPENIPQSELENTMINIFRRIGVTLDSYQIAACHRLKRRVGDELTSRVIIRFINRKNSYRCLDNKKYLRNIREYPNIYVHESLCFKYKDLFDECMAIKCSGKIAKLWIYNGVIHVKKSNNYNERPKKIYSMSDIERYFPAS